MQIAKKFTGSLPKTIITSFLKTCVFPQKLSSGLSECILTNLSEKNYQNCENFGLKLQKKLGNYKVSKKLIGRTPGDVGGSF